MSTVARLLFSFFAGFLTFIVLHLGLGISEGWTIAACAAVGALLGLIEVSS